MQYIFLPNYSEDTPLRNSVRNYLVEPLNNEGQDVDNIGKSRDVGC